MKLLLERDADVDLEDGDGNTALHLAAQQGHTDACRLLLGKSDADAENEEGNTPVWLAFEAGKSECAEAILREGEEADVNAACEVCGVLLARCCRRAVSRRTRPHCIAQQTYTAHCCHAAAEGGALADAAPLPASTGRQDVPARGGGGRRAC